MADNRLYLADTFNKSYVYFIRDSASGIYIKNIDLLNKFLEEIVVSDYLKLIKETDGAIYDEMIDNYDEFDLKN